MKKLLCWCTSVVVFSLLAQVATQTWAQEPAESSPRKGG